MRRSLLVGLTVLELGCRPSDGSLAVDGILVATATTRVVAPSVTVVGTIEHARPVDVSTEVAGRIVRSYVRAGDFVTAGQPLALIDTVPLAATVATARVRQMQAAVAVERVMRDSATATDKLFILRELRQRTESGASDQDLRVAQRVAEQAALVVQDARLAVKLADLALADAERALGRAVVRSPFSGVVVRILSPSGAVAVTGTSSASLAGIARIASADSVWIRLTIPVQFLLGVRRGQQVFVRSLDEAHRFRDTAQIVGVEENAADGPVPSVASGESGGRSTGGMPTVMVVAAMSRRRLPVDWPMGVPVEAVVQAGAPVRGLAVPLAALVPASMAPGGREGVWEVVGGRTHFVPITSGPDDGVWAITNLKRSAPLVVAVGSTASLLLRGEGQSVTIAGQWEAR